MDVERGIHRSIDRSDPGTAGEKGGAIGLASPEESAVRVVAAVGGSAALAPARIHGDAARAIRILAKHWRERPTRVGPV